MRAGGDQHALTNVLHMHRLLLALCAAQWLCALVGLQARADLAAPAQPGPISAGPEPVPPAPEPAAPPPIIPHRGPRPPLPAGLKRFTAWGPLSYVRLGREVLGSADLHRVVHHLIRWLASYLRSWTPLWLPGQLRDRLAAWWIDTS